MCSSQDPAETRNGTIFGMSHQMPPRKMVDDLTAWPCRRVDSQAASAHCPILEGPGQAELAGSAPSEPPTPANLAKSSTLPRLDGPMRRNQSNVSIVVRASISSPIFSPVQAFSLRKPLPASSWFFSRACELTNTHIWRAVKQRATILYNSHLLSADQRFRPLEVGSKVKSIPSRGFEPLSPLCCCHPPRAPYL